MDQGFWGPPGQPSDAQGPLGLSKPDPVMLGGCVVWEINWFSQGPQES